MPQLKSADSNPTNSMNRNDLRKETKPTFSCLNSSSRSLFIVLGKGTLTKSIEIRTYTGTDSE